jgi:DNA ligase-1
MQSLFPAEVDPGRFIPPSGAQLRSIRSSGDLTAVWAEVGRCVAYDKPDGWRIQVHKVEDEVRLFSRSGKEWTTAFPSIINTLQTQTSKHSYVLDTELVGYDVSGVHMQPSRLRSAAHLHCHILDGLMVDSEDLTGLATLSRVRWIRECLSKTFSDRLFLAGYTVVEDEDQLTTLYEQACKRKGAGFDGLIVKRLDTTYFSDALKLKPEDTIDAVVVGAFHDSRGDGKSLLLAVLDAARGTWVPIGKVARSNIDWEEVWAACQPYITQHQPDNILDPPYQPDMWIVPHVVVQATVTTAQRSTGYLVRAEYLRQCVLREDKGPEQASNLAHFLQLAGMEEAAQDARMEGNARQLRLFDTV